MQAQNNKADSMHSIVWYTYFSDNVTEKGISYQPY